MASTSTVQHRFANKDYNFERGLKGSSVHIDGKNYYSYSTVFGQWVDEKVCLVFHGDTSVTSHKHFLWGSYFPEDVVLLPYDDGGSYYYGWHGCDLLGCSEEFKLSHRWRLMDYWMSEIYAALEEINGGKTKNLDSHARHAINEYWPYMGKLCSLYKDTTIPEYLKRCDKKYKKLVKALKDGERDVHTLTDALFGEGTFKTYWDYCARYRKAENKRANVEALCARLGIASPYESCTRGRMNTGLTADQIRKLTAKERNDIHFIGLMNKELYDKESERKEKRNKNSDNAYKWITGYAPKLESKWNHEYRETRECRNMFTGVEYELPKSYVYGYYWLKTAVKFEYGNFRKAEDKEQWIREFYAECEEVQDNVKGLRILEKVGAHTHEKERSYEDSRYIDDEFLRENTTESEYWYAHRFIELQEQHFADEEARRRAAEIARLKREEEERKEREYMEQVRKEQIDACVARGAEGARDLWRLHLTELYTAEECCKTEDFFYKGNVLLRLNLNKDTVETSKNIRIPVEVCKKIWRIVSKWHENPSCFKEMQIDTKGSGRYTISSYKNDILTAGCHKIAFVEMQRMYNEIINA